MADLAPPRVGDADHGHGRDAGVGGQRGLDLRGEMFSQSLM
ncbi:hypothetical protein [Georgenia sp.]